MMLLSRNRVKKIRDRFTGRVRYVAESQVKMRRGKVWIRINPRLMQRADIYRGSPVAVFATSGMRMVVVKRLRRVKGKIGHTGVIEDQAL